MDSRFDARDDMKLEDERTEDVFYCREIDDDLKREEAEEQAAIRLANTSQINSSIESFADALREDLRDGHLSIMSPSQISWMIDRFEDLRAVNGIEQYIKLLNDARDEQEEREKESDYIVETRNESVDNRIDSLENVLKDLSKYDSETLKEELKAYERSGTISDDLRSFLLLNERFDDLRDESLKDEDRVTSSDSKEINSIISRISKKR